MFLTKKKMRVYMDRFYCSPDLLFTHANIGIGACGAVQPDRKKKMLGRTRDPRANGAWLSKLTE